MLDWSLDLGPELDAVPGDDTDHHLPPAGRPELLQPSPQVPHNAAKRVQSLHLAVLLLVLVQLLHQQRKKTLGNKFLLAERIVLRNFCTNEMYVRALFLSPTCNEVTRSRTKTGMRTQQTAFQT